MVLERYFRFEISLLSILCMLIARMEMGTSRVSGDSDIITQSTEHLLDGNGRVLAFWLSKVPSAKSRKNAKLCRKYNLFAVKLLNFHYVARSQTPQQNGKMHIKH